MWGFLNGGPRLYEEAQKRTLEAGCELRRFQTSMERMGPPKPPAPCRRADQDPIAKEEERELWERKWTTYKKMEDIRWELKVILHECEGDELNAKQALEMARLEYLATISHVSAGTAELERRTEQAELNVHLMQARIGQLELAEREQNAPIRKRVLDAAVDAWGPDHASRPPHAPWWQAPHPPRRRKLLLAAATLRMCHGA